jgi:hypothetical protein
MKPCPISARLSLTLIAAVSLTGFGACDSAHQSPLVGTWTYSGQVPAIVTVALTFKSDGTLVLIEDVAPPTRPAGVVADGCITTDTYFGKFKDTESGHANTLTWTFTDGTANAVSGCNTPSYNSAGTPMTVEALEAYRDQGLVPPETTNFTVTSTELILNPTVTNAVGLSARTTFTKAL